MKGEKKMTIDEQITAEVLRTIARDEQIKESVLRSSSLYPLLLAAAKRYVTGETRQEVQSRAKELEKKGYRLSVEYIGENTLDAKACEQVKDEFLAVIDDCSVLQRPVGVSFDLSHVGLLVSQEQAFAHVEEMAVAAARNQHDVMISMEESTKTEAIMAMYERLAQRHENVGITIQAHLHRSVEDVQRVLALPGKIRLVKGAFKEPRDIALARSAELNERYLQLAEMCVKAGHTCAFATHDQLIVDELQKRDYFSHPEVELELLYGVRPELAQSMQQNGIPVRLYLTYGKEWYLYLCHRIAEYPPNIHKAIADMFDPTRTAHVGYGEK
ncbi:proline dehydrogenase family protein [Brevibacillus choshinensis]|uniref:proline dehydrogenase family protein n=1 Tax=Brevibacillus choshinensis TaxID=54911 RepID=UPI002E20A2F5|nr:proline dehydrogenase family protein [Brevibacillus choshinensis]